MRYCNQATITDVAFVHLRGIQLLTMDSCRQITDAALVHLRGIQKRDMAFYLQETITDAAFVLLRGIHTLGLAYCNQNTDACTWAGSKISTCAAATR